MKRNYLLAIITILSSIVAFSQNNDGNDPLSLIFTTSNNSSNELITAKEVDRFFNTVSSPYIYSILESSNCYTDRNGILLGNATTKGALTFNLAEEYRKEICRIFVQYSLSGNSTAELSINGSNTKELIPTGGTSAYTYFDIEIPAGNMQSLKIESSRKICLISLIVIYSDSKAAAGDVESVRIPMSSRTINVGETSMIQTLVTPIYATDKTLAFSSDNEAVATVDEDGLITAISKGTAVITATSRSTPSVFAVTTVTVVEIAPTSIDLATTDTNIGVGGSIKLDLIFEPEDAVKTVEWSTTWGEYIDLDQNGVVTAKKYKSIVNAKATSTVNPSVFKTCVIRMSEVLPVSSVAVSPTVTTLEVNESMQLTTTVLPLGASDRSIRWESSDPAVAEVDETGIVTAVSPGECLITATAADGSQQESSCSVTVVEYETSSIELLQSDNSDMRLSTEGCMVKIHGIISGQILKVYDLNGRCLVNKTIASDSVTFTLPGKNVYIVSVGAAAYKIAL